MIRRRRRLLIPLVALICVIHYSFIKNDEVLPACVLPILNPYDVEILQHWKEPNRAERLECPVEQRQFTYIDEETLTLRLNLTIYNAAKHNCSYRTFDRATSSDSEIVYGDTKHFFLDLTFSNDFIEIWCSQGPLKVYHFIHACPRVRDTSDEDLLLLPTSEEHLSVVMYMQDSMSRSSFIRELPKTFHFLKDEAQAFVFNGYHKVGKNTIPNMFPLLTGLFYDRSSTDELGYYIGENDAYYDDLEDVLVFAKFKSAGYATSFMEDHPNYGIFHYDVGKGFLNPHKLFTHYCPPYSFLRDRYSKEVLHRYGIRDAFTRPACFRNQPCYLLDLQLMEHTMRRYAGYRHFTLLSLADLSHHPEANHIHRVDEELKATLARMLHNLNHTVLIVLSDHGMRYGEARATTAGFLEERLPFFSVRFPPWFLKKHPHIQEALEVNSERLTSHFDTHATLLDILKGNYQQRIGIPTRSRHGRSLLRQIPFDRTCASASIPSDICTCNIVQSAAIGDGVVQETAEITVNFMNTLLTKETDHCAVLRLDEVLRFCSHIQALVLAEWARMNRSATAMRDDTALLRLRTQPNGGEYEAVMRLDGNEEGKRWTVSSVTRTNEYGEQSECVRDKELREFCYCNVSEH